MAIVFSEGHLLLFVRYTVIIFQSIKRLYLAQLAACTKVKESASPPLLVVTAHINEQMQREDGGGRRGSHGASEIQFPSETLASSVNTAILFIKACLLRLI